MKGFFLPNGGPTILMPGDQIVFTQNGKNPEILEFYRNNEKLRFIFSAHQMVERMEFSRKKLHVERIRDVILIAAVAGTNYVLVERGEKRTVFQLI